MSRKVTTIGLFVTLFVIIMSILFYIVFFNKKNNVNKETTNINQNIKQEMYSTDQNDKKEKKCALVHFLPDQKYEIIMTKSFYERDSELFCGSAVVRYSDNLNPDKEQQDWLFYSESENLDDNDQSKINYKIFAYNFLTHEKKLIFDLAKEDSKLIDEKSIGTPVLYLSKGWLFLTFEGYLAKGAVFYTELPPYDIKFKKIYEGLDPKIVKISGHYFILSGFGDAGTMKIDYSLIIRKVRTYTPGYDIEIGPVFSTYSSDGDEYSEGIYQIYPNSNDLMSGLENLWFYHYSHNTNSVDDIFVLDPYKGTTSSIFSEKRADIKTPFYISGTIPTGIEHVMMDGVKNILYMQGKGYYYLYDLSKKDAVLEKNTGKIPEITPYNDQDNVEMKNGWCQSQFCSFVVSKELNNISLPSEYAVTVISE